MSLPPGRYIGRIRIDAMIGAGGMGEVWRGWDERLERPVALKVIHPNKLVDAGVRSRFLREARLLSKLDHPSICRIRRGDRHRATARTRTRFRARARNHSS